MYHSRINSFGSIRIILPVDQNTELSYNDSFETIVLYWNLEVTVGPGWKSREHIVTPYLFLLLIIEFSLCVFRWLHWCKDHSISHRYKICLICICTYLLSLTYGSEKKIKKNWKQKKKFFNDQKYHMVYYMLIFQWSEDRLFIKTRDTEQEYIRLHYLDINCTKSNLSQFALYIFIIVIFYFFYFSRQSVGDSIIQSND